MRTLMSAPPTDRVGRYPKHKFIFNAYPYTAQPFMLARVLPGETLTNLFFEARGVTKPVVSSIIGWKQEFYYYYVRISDLLLDAARDMFIDPTNTDATTAIGAAGANVRWTYTPAGGIDWMNKCLTKVVEADFRDEGETAAAYTASNGSFIVQIKDDGALQSLTDKDDVPEGGTIASATDMGDLDRLLDAFEQLRALGLQNMSYEDWLRSNGIAIPNKDENKPELIARWSEFQYPSNTINPTDGSAASAV